MLCQEVLNYLQNVKGLPFFYVVGDAQYAEVLEEFKNMDLTILRMSDFCPRDDKFPSIDELVDTFRTSDVDYRDNKFVVIGLGEYLALRGSLFAEKELLRLKNVTLGNARAILLLRGVAKIVNQIVEQDNKILMQQRACLCAKAKTEIAITNVPKETGLVKNPGIQNLLRTLEDGATGAVYASTALLLDNSLLRLNNVTDAYTAIHLLYPDLHLDGRYGTPEQWQQLLADLQNCNHDVNAVFAHYHLDDTIADDIVRVVSGDKYQNWLAYLYLQFHVERWPNAYLRVVLQNTTQFSDFKANLLNTILSYTHQDPGFRQLYDARKRLLRDFAEEDIAPFVQANDVDYKESLYRLTDNTALERKTIVKWLTHHGLSNDVQEALRYVYPNLASYLKKYTFTCPVLAGELTEYFNAYKVNKVLNRVPLSESFMRLVEKHAQDLSFAKLPTRDNAILHIKNKENAQLYWIDALGVEYLSLMQDLADRYGLAMQVEIASAKLPTITSVNRGFYDDWQGKSKFKEERLDNIKHKEKGGYFFTDDPDPIHIPAELDVIQDAMSRAAMELSQNRCKSFVIASDHGASRLAVIKKQEIPYDSDTKGEHSGRCCKWFAGCDVPYKVEDADYIILTDYGRFRGSRAANVEVHGGASLEEVVVPVVTLTLKRQGIVKLKVLYDKNEKELNADRHAGVTLTLYISAVSSPGSVRLVLEENSYTGIALDDTHYRFTLSDIRRARKDGQPYTAMVYDDSGLLGSVSFSVKKKGGRINEDFDFGDL